jgi:hypothetical protein
VFRKLNALCYFSAPLLPNTRPLQQDRHLVPESDAEKQAGKKSTIEELKKEANAEAHR